MTHRARNAYLVFLIIGLAMVIPGLLISSQNALLLMNGERTSAVITSYVEGRDGGGNLQYKPVYEYTINGTRYEQTSNFSTSWRPYEVGEEAVVLYTMSNPEKARLNRFAGLWMLPVIFGSVGLGFVFIGAIGLAKIERRRKAAQELQYSGQRLDTTFQYLKKGLLKLNNKSSYKIVTQGTNPQNGDVLEFQSDLLWFNPEQYMTTGQAIQVAIDPSNTKRYWMDLSFLPDYNG